MGNCHGSKVMCCGDVICRVVVLLVILIVMVVVVVVLILVIMVVQVLLVVNAGAKSGQVSGLRCQWVANCGDRTWCRRDC